MDNLDIWDFVELDDDDLMFSMDLSQMGFCEDDILQLMSGVEHELQHIMVLNIAANAVSDLTEICKLLPGLTWINCSDNQIQDLRPLMDLPNLNSVIATGNNIQAINFRKSQFIIFEV
jgi:Leucine-rich repeat (LRR) protein